MIRIIIPALLFSILFGQSNPIDIGTVGARQLRMVGQLNISHNPATLGYLATTVDADTLNTIEESVDSLVSDFSDEIEQEVIEENIVDTDTVDSEFAEFDDFEEASEDSLSNESEEINIEEIIEIAETIDSSEVAESISIELPNSNPQFSMSLISLAFGLGSGVITPDWINDQLFGGRDLRDPEQKEKFLDGLSDDVNVQLPLASSLPIVNISFGPNVIGLGQVRSYTSINLPSGLTQLPFKGLPSGEVLDLSDLEIEHITYLPVSYSRGFVLKPGIVPFGRESYAGVRANLLVGLAEIHTENVSGILQGTGEHTLIDTDIEINSSIPFDIDTGTPKISLSYGFGIDLGIITEIDDRLTVGASIDNLIASINWKSGERYTASSAGEITAEEISESDSVSEYLDQSEIRESVSYKTSLPMSINLSGSYLAKDWAVLDANLRIDVGDTYWASESPTISLGSEFFPGSKVPFYLGISLGGHYGFSWGTGLSIKMGSFIMDIAGGQEGGLFNSATGMRAGFGLRIEK
ncbi:uncharacterized protein METZ01_LOCUS7008 [marine metagenome]|uniref:DUF5723 domain-containing protein n=1 Tax=marine metagenome TaxID=408172 RepID=A0A381NJ52_9ZZZZ